jgi:hypothetical protein
MSGIIKKLAEETKGKKSLGLQVDTNLNWNKHTEYIIHAQGFCHEDSCTSHDNRYPFQIITVMGGVKKSLFLKTIWEFSHSGYGHLLWKT